MCLLNEADTLIDMNYSDDTLILSKSESKKYVEIVSYDIESSRSRLYQFEVSDFENGLSNNSIMLSDDKDYYLFNNLNSESYLYTIDKESEKIFCQNFTNKNIEKIFTDGKGALYVLSVDYDIRRKYSL